LRQPAPSGNRQPGPRAPRGVKRVLARVAAAAVAVAAATLAALLACGCGTGKPAAVHYSIKQGGVVIGTESVSVSRDAQSSLYTSIVRRPYLEYDTSYYQRFRLSADLRRIEEYQGNRRWNGVTFPIYLQPVAAAGQTGAYPTQYDYLQNNLQTFQYLPGQSFPLDFLPVEPHSAGTFQALLDEMLSAAGTKPVAAMVPSRDTVLRQAVFTRRGAGRGSLDLGGFGVFDVAYEEKTGVIDELADKSSGLSFERDGGGRLSSRPYAPTTRQVREVRVPTLDKLQLAGAFYVPTGKPPYRVAVLVGGEGPQDRTGLGMLSQLADRLADSGIAVLVCDKRGVRPSQGDFGKYTLQTAVEDLNSELDYLILRSDIDTDHIYVVGYDGGGVVATACASANPYVSACVFMATPTVRLFPELARHKVEEAAAAGQIDAADVKFIQAQIDGLVQIVDTFNSDLVDVLGHQMFLGWMRGYMDHEQLAAAAALDVPVLVMQGAADTTVTPDQAASLMATLQARGRGGQELAMFKGLDHQFGPRVGEAEAKPYRAHPAVAQEVLDRLAGWLKGR